MHDGAATRGTWRLWIGTDNDVEHPGTMVARAHEADHQGGTVLPYARVADTRNALRVIQPKGLMRHDRTSASPPDVIETWD
jgi:hypothetical protein